MDVLVVSAGIANRVFVGGTFEGGDITVAGTTISNFPPHDSAYVFALDGSGNDVSISLFGTNGYNFEPHHMEFDAAGSLYVGGTGTGGFATSVLYLQKYGASPWGIIPAMPSMALAQYEYGLVVGSDGDPIFKVSADPPGVNWGAGQQSGPHMVKYQASNGAFVWSKPPLPGLPRRDAAGNLIFLSVNPFKLTRSDAELVTISSKTFVGTGSLLNFVLGPGGDVLIAALFQGSVDFGCGVMSSVGNANNLVVARLDSLWNCIYSKRFDPGGYHDSPPVYPFPTALGLTPAGDAIVVGSKTGSVDFGGGAVPPGYFALRLGAAGDYKSLFSMPDPGTTYAAVDGQGAVYFASSSPDFDVGTGALLANVKGVAVAKIVP